MGYLWWRSRRSANKRGSNPDRPHGCVPCAFGLFKFSNSKPANYFIRDQPFGIEEPRNRLEDENPSSSMVKADKDSNNVLMPMGYQIKSSGGHSIFQMRVDQKIKTDILSSETCNSPITNTPNLVARLMGLDSLPENFSPTLNPSKISKPIEKEFPYWRSSPINGRHSLDFEINGSRSLPVSPRTSVTRKSDVDHHRLSLQIFREDTSLYNDLEFSGKNRARVQKEKESVGRKFGTNISNNEMSNKEPRRDHILLVKPKKEVQKKINNKENQVSMPALKGVKEKNEKPIQKKNEQSKSKRSVQSARRVQEPCDILRNKKEEMFVQKSKETREKKSEKIPSFGELLSPPKKSQESDASSSKRAPQLSNRLGQYMVTGTSSNGSSNDVTSDQYYYILEVLKFLGIDENTPVSFAKSLSSCHPLHSLAFDYLENIYSYTENSQMCHRSNRKLTFDLVNEVLDEIFKPYSETRLCVFDYRRDRTLLINKLISKIQSFQRVDCNDLEDIDRLVEADFRRWYPSVASEEGDAIVAELEDDIVDTIVNEMVVDVVLSKRNMN